ncbi:hypothetical protein AB0C89_38080, partial [Streptomyces sp. NPDC048491]
DVRGDPRHRAAQGPDPRARLAGLLSFYADTVRDQLGVDEGKLLVGVSFGYADEYAPVNRVATGRAALKATTTFHT